MYSSFLTHSHQSFSLYNPKIKSDVHDLLQKEQIKGVALHSQMKQDKRESQLNLFRSGKCPILLATDVAARGIHVKNVDYVINYDFPGSLEQVRISSTLANCLVPTSNVSPKLFLVDGCATPLVMISMFTAVGGPVGAR